MTSPALPSPCLSKYSKSTQGGNMVNDNEVRMNKEYLFWTFLSPTPHLQVATLSLIHSEARLPGRFGGGLWLILMTH